MALTDLERERVRSHLGYPQVRADKSLQFGLVRSVETSYLVDSAMDNLAPTSEDRVRALIKTCDDIEQQMQCTVGNLEVSRIDTISLRKDATDAMESEFCRWAYRLAEVLGVPVYPYAERFKRGKKHGTIPVRNS